MDEQTQLQQRLDDVELMLVHLCGNSYAPTHAATAAALGRIQARCAPALKTATQQTSAQTLSASEPSLADRVFEAAAAARRARARVDTLREEGANDDAILEAQVAAEEAETHARELSEQAREHYGTQPQTS
ncbi:MAG: hypothetical protein AAGA54_35325 [Myxococcota bacterium]